MWNFFECEKDLRYLLKLENYKELPECSNNLNRIWFDMQIELYNEFGVKGKAKRALKLEKQFELCRLEYALTEDIHILSHAERYAKQLQQLIKNISETKRTSLQVEASDLEVDLKLASPIDIKECTVARYYGLVEKRNNNAKRNTIKSRKARR